MTLDIFKLMEKSRPVKDKKKNETLHKKNRRKNVMKPKTRGSMASAETSIYTHRSTRKKTMFRNIEEIYGKLIHRLLKQQ